MIPSDVKNTIRRKKDAEKFVAFKISSYLCTRKQGKDP